MAGTNGKAPQHHLSVAEIVAKARANRSEPFFWEGPDIDVLVRPRTADETAMVVLAEQRLVEAAEQYKGTSDEPEPAEYLRLSLRVCAPCILDPDTREPLFTADDVDALMEMDTPSLNAIIGKVNTLSNFTRKQAEEAEKNSVTTDDASMSSVSPSAAATPASLPTPIR
jgi:hypothetical protein